MLRKLVMTIAAFLLVSSTLLAKPLSLSEVLEGTCRIHAGNSIGSGVIYYEDNKSYYALTNYHVVSNNNNVQLRLFSEGYRTYPIPGTVTFRAYRPGVSLDVAIVQFSKAALGNYHPTVIPLAPKGYKVASNSIVCSAGCPRGRTAMAWYGRVRSSNNGVISFNPAPESGQSGSGLIVQVPDAEGDLHSMIAGIVAWNVNEQYGAGVSLDQIHNAMSGNYDQYQTLPTHYTPAAHEVPYTLKAKQNTKTKDTGLRYCKWCHLPLDEHLLATDGKYYCWPENGSMINLPRGIYAADQHIRTQLLACPNGPGMCPLNPWNRRPPPSPYPQQPQPQPQPQPQQPQNPGGGGIFEGKPPEAPAPPKEEPAPAPENEEVQKLKAELENVQKSSGLLAKAKADLESKVSGLNDKLKSLVDEKALLEGARDKLQTAKTDLETKAKSLVEENGLLKAAHEKLQAVHDGVTSKVEGLTSLIRSRDETITVQKTKIEEQGKIVAESTSRLDELRAKLKDSDWYNNLYLWLAGLLPIPGGIAGWFLRKLMDRGAKKAQPLVEGKLEDILSDVQGKVEGVEGIIQKHTGELGINLSGKLLDGIVSKVTPLFDDLKGRLEVKHVQPPTANSKDPLNHPDYREPPAPVVAQPIPQMIYPQPVMPVPVPQPQYMQGMYPVPHQPVQGLGPVPPAMPASRYSADEILAAIDNIARTHSGDLTLSVVPQLVKQELEKPRTVTGRR